MNELRWHPLQKQWVVVATARQDRPQLPQDWCPFDPGPGKKVPEHYDVYLYPNDFPALDFHNAPFDPTPGLYRTTGAQGSCDVVLYSPDHNLLPSQLTPAQWRKVIDLWTERYHTLSEQEVIQYVSIFENTGVAIGVTMPHPHGQIYAFPFLPPQEQIEMSAAQEHFQQHNECLYCRILATELAEKQRLVAENDSFVAFVPFAARFPSEVQMYSRRHVAELQDLTEKEKQDLAALLSVLRKKYDNLYNLQLPLMMLVRQPPTKGEHPYFHFHLDFLPLQRSAKKLKYLASVESGLGTFLADTKPEEKAAELRAAEPQA